MFRDEISEIAIQYPSRYITLSLSLYEFYLFNIYKITSNGSLQCTMHDMGAMSIFGKDVYIPRKPRTNRQIQEEEPKEIQEEEPKEIQEEEPEEIHVEDPRYRRFNILVEVASLFRLREEENEKKPKRLRVVFSKSRPQSSSFEEEEEEEEEEKVCPTRNSEDYMKRAICRAGGSPENAVMVIKKELTSSDVSCSQSRLLIPVLKITSGFLTKEEDDCLKLHKEEGCSLKKTMEVSLIQPCVEEVSILKLRRWEMVKDCGNNCTNNYVLNSGWNKVVSTNGLKKGDMVRLLAFRNKCGRLCFALFKD